MEDRFSKYSKLYVLIFLSMLAFFIAIALVLATMYGLSKIISSQPFDIFYELFVISIPTSVFCTAYIIFFKRTKNHPSQIVKIISHIAFVLAVICCVVVLIISFYQYFKIGIHDIMSYACFSLPFLAGNIALLFLIAILQALTTTKELDWHDKRKLHQNKFIL